MVVDGKFFYDGIEGFEYEAGYDYRLRIGSVGEFQAWFRTDADCLDYLEWLRWPDGFVCPSCDHEGGWRLGDGRFMCPACSTL